MKAAVTMLPLRFANRGDRPLRVLCLGSHSDDIEIGCGGTILRLLDEYDAICAHWVVFAANSERRAEAEKSANLFLAKASTREVVLKDFNESFFPYTAHRIKEYFESLKSEFSPDIIFTHYRHDLHQDHRLISELTWNSFRNHFILEYEVLKYDGDLGSPNFFVHLDETVCKKKIGFVGDSFRSQAHKDWFTPDAFWSVLRIRGVESKAPGKYAEGFYCRKLVF